MFDVGQAGQMNAGVLWLVSGTHDWVVPSGQKPFVCEWRGEVARNGAAATQFVWPKAALTSTLRAHGAGGLGPEALCWPRTNAAFRGRAAAAPWPQRSVAVARDRLGDNTYPLMNVHPQLKTLRCLPIPKRHTEALKRRQSRNVRSSPHNLGSGPAKGSRGGAEFSLLRIQEIRKRSSRQYPAPLHRY